MAEQLIVNATLTCPTCNTEQPVVMPVDGFQHFYKCVNCEDELTPLEEKDCVFCSYADSPCPMKQQGITPATESTTPTAL